VIWQLPENSADPRGLYYYRPVIRFRKLVNYLIAISSLVGFSRPDTLKLSIENRAELSFFKMFTDALGERVQRPQYFRFVRESEIYSEIIRIRMLSALN